MEIALNFRSILLSHLFAIVIFVHAHVYVKCIFSQKNQMIFINNLLWIFIEFIIAWSVFSWYMIPNS